MTSTDLINRYMADLEDALWDLPTGNRNELLTEIRSHIDEAVPSPELVNESEVVDTLHQLGSPTELADEARMRLGVPTFQRGPRETLALLLVSPLGVVLPFVAWAAGAIMLWRSGAWTTKEKWIGTLAPPLGVSLIFLANFIVSPLTSHVCKLGRDTRGVLFDTCQGGLSVGEWTMIALAAVLVVTSLFTTLLLARRMRLRTS